MAGAAEGLAWLALLTLLPGPDTLLTLRQSLARGLDAALVTAAGVSTGTVAHGTLAGAGLAVVVAEARGALAALQALGVAVLAFLGLRSLGAAWRMGAGLAPAAPRALESAYRDGLLTNLLNPKVVLFYLAFLPQFFQEGRSALAEGFLFGLAHACMGMLWLGWVAYAAHRVRALADGPRFRRGVEAVAGASLLAFALRLAWAQA